MENKSRRTSNSKSTKQSGNRTQERTERSRSTGEVRRKQRPVEGQRQYRTEERPRRRKGAELDEDFTILLGDDVKSIRSGANGSNKRRQQDNIRKTTSKKSEYENNNRTKKPRRGRGAKKENTLSKRVGVWMAGIQIFASLIFVIAVLILNMLPTKYVLGLFILLVLFAALGLIGQLLSKKNAIIGKVLSGVISVVLLVGAYFIFQASGTLSAITGGDVKVDNMVVAVLADDPAESIQDAADYVFGVQYTLKGDETTSAITAIEEEEGLVLDVVEYADMAALAIALQDGEVDAIIYNEAYAGIIEEENSSFATDIKIIYEHGIESTLSITNDTASTVEVENEPFIVYISGIDVYGSITKTSRSDVNIMAVVNPETAEILLVTTPRDYYVTFPGVTGGSYDKLTHAGIYGVDTSVSALEELYDTEIDFYARVNFTSLIDMVDALGGITVYSEYAFSSEATPTGEKVYFSVGDNVLDGASALAFCRERKSLTDGDNQRGKNQQAVIVGMIEKVTSPAIITGASQLLESVSGNVDTNMTETQIQNLIKMQIDEMIDWNITSVAATGTGSTEWCYSYSGSKLYVTIPDDESVELIKTQIQTILDGGSLEDLVDEDTE